MVAGLFQRRSRTVLMPLFLMMVRMGVVTLLSEKGIFHVAISGEKERSMPLIKYWLDGAGADEEDFFLQLKKTNAKTRLNMILLRMDMI